MSDKLKLCPFCGGRASVWMLRGIDTIICDNCSWTMFFPYQSHETMLAQWNTRSERTGHIEPIYSNYNDVEIVLLECSECGQVLEGYEKYCHKCGVRLVEE